MTRRRLAPEGLRPGQVTGDKPESRAKLVGLHAHGCTVCGARYTDACTTPLVNARCQDCRGCGHGRPMWETDYDPVACCRTNSRPAGARQRQTYRLGGEGRWWLCHTCSRTHPYDPTTGPRPGSRPGTGADL